MCPVAPDLGEFENLSELEELRAANATLQVKLKRAKAKTEDLVQATMDGARQALVAMGPGEPVSAPKLTGGRGKPEVALWHLTDWQGSKVTTSYNSKIMRERVLRYCDKAIHLTDIQRRHHPVDRCVIMFGGDLVEGLFNYPAQPFEIDATIFGQFGGAARLAADVVRRALAAYKAVHVVCEWGNHGRIGSKRAAVPRSDNFDRMVQALARAMLAGEDDRLTWQASDEDMQRVTIGNYRALLIHGDEVGRNGYASPMTIVNHVAKWQSGGYPWAFQDCYLGHFHTHNSWSLPNGRGSVYQTGSPESDNRYAGVHMASNAVPSQRLHFVNERKGLVTAEYRVWLDKADKEGP